MVRKGAFWRSDAFVGAAMVLAVLYLTRRPTFSEPWSGGSTISQAPARPVHPPTGLPSSPLTTRASPARALALAARHPRGTDRQAGGRPDPDDRPYRFLHRAPDGPGPGLHPQDERRPAAGRWRRRTAGPLRERLSQIIVEAESSLDTDGKLASSISRAGDAVLPSIYRLGEPLGSPDLTFASGSRARSPMHRVLEAALSGQQPLERFGAPAAGIGHLNQLPDADGYLRREPGQLLWPGRCRRWR